MTALQHAIAHPAPVEGIGTTSPVAGLARRSVGGLDVLAQSVAAVAPSAAATTIPLLVASVAGGSTVWAIAAAMALALLVATTINQFTKRMAATGSLYTFVSRGLGPAASIITGVAMLVGYGFIAMFALGGSGYYVAILVGRFLPEVDAPVVIGLGVVVAMAAACALVLARGIRVSTRVALLVELVSVVIIVALIAALLWLRVPQIDWSAFRIDGIAPADFAVGAALALTAFVGFESASTLGVEARRPFANVPRAIIWTVIVSGVLYLLASYSQLAGFAVLGREVAASASPVNDLASAFGVGWLGMLLDVSIAASFLACAIASITALARVLFSMGREGLLPGSFGRTHRRFRTPFVAVVVSVPIIAAVLIVTILLTGGVWEAMEVLIVGAAGGYIVAYALACVAAPVFLWRIGELTVGVVLRAGVAAAALSVMLVVYLVAESTSARAPGVIVFLVAMVIGVSILAVRAVRRPWLRHTLGVYDVPIGTDVLGGPHGNETIAPGTRPSETRDVP